MFEWEPPASEDAIRQAERDYGGALPEDYVAFLRVSNGGRTQGNLSLLEVEDCVQRNRDYEVAEYMPGYFMIGDDGGGTAIVLKLADQRIYEVDMGVMDEDSAQLSADSLQALIKDGMTLSERS